VSRFEVIEPGAFQRWLGTWHTWATEVNIWMHNHLEQLQRLPAADERLIPLMEAMWLYALDLAKHMHSMPYDLDLDKPLLVAAYAAGESKPRFVAAVERVPMVQPPKPGTSYTQKFWSEKRQAFYTWNTDPETMALDPTIWLYDEDEEFLPDEEEDEAEEEKAEKEKAEKEKAADSVEIEGGSAQAELSAGSLEAVVWEPAVSQSPRNRRTDLAELDAWLLEEMHCTYMIQKNSFREVGVFTSGNPP
jgi:hypothetical protein